ncbi:MAG: hypothetical protein NC421_02080 [Lachnospiraceae bacterium]|nr:hypothetical protein [Lachnospiraceae bacterium]
MLFKRILSSAALILCSVAGWSQTESDVNISQGGYGMVKTNFGISYNRGFSSVRDGYDGRISYEIVSSRAFTLTANARYSAVNVDFSDDDISDGYDPDEINLNGTHTMGQIGLTSMLRLRLLGKPVMGMAMVNSEWGIGGFARVSGIAMALVMLKADRDTQFGLGPLVMINSTSKIPAFLVFMYRHRFNDRWLLNLYGGMFGFDYTPTRDDLISFGADIDVKSFYFKPDDESLPKRCRFTTTAFRPTVKYRHRLARNLYFDAQCGVAVKMSCRVNGVTGTKEYFDCRRKTAPFVQASVSYSL